MSTLRGVDSILSDLGLPPRTFPPSFTLNSQNPGLRLGQSQRSGVARIPNVTAIILNWSRPENVIRIASLLCGPWLDDTIAEVYVWNNSPLKLSKETFAARCDTRKLRIENSPSNLYFYARFLACTKVTTPYCFIQDDDYIILPEVVKTLRARMEESSQEAIYLLPPHEHLSSRLRTTITPNGIHTGFAWLGHGAIVRRQQAVHFVSLLHHDSLGITEEQIKMADNYFSILNNDIPEIWFDQGIELGGGQPFTVGPEGDERNRKHISNACRYLDEILARQSQFSPVEPNDSQNSGLAFVKLGSYRDDYQVNRASALGNPYLLESNIKVLPDGISLHSHGATDLLRNEERCTELIGHDAISHYQKHPLSCAVDGMPETAFRSPYDAKQGDYILIDMLSTFEFDGNVVELVFLLASDNAEIVRNSTFECSTDGKHWLASPHSTVSRPTMVAAKSTSGQDGLLIECSTRMPGDRARFFKATLNQDIPLPWVVYEVWARSVPH